MSLQETGIEETPSEVMCSLCQGSGLGTGKDDDCVPITQSWARSVGVRWLRWKYAASDGLTVVGFITKMDGNILEIHTRGQLREICRLLEIRCE